MEKTQDKIYKNSGNIELLKLINKRAGRVLDIGFGNGDNSRILKKSGFKIDGVTLSQKEADAVTGLIENVFIHNLELGLPTNLNNTYDVVICSHVIEHIAYPERLLFDIHSILKPDGILLVALPNIMHYKFRWQLLLGNFPTANEGIWDYTHLRWYTFYSAQVLLKNAGFHLTVATADGDIPLLSLFKFIPKKLRVFIYRKILLNISNGFFGGQLLYSCNKHL